MARVLLVNPQNNQLPWIPLGLISIGAVIKEKGHEVKVIDRELDKNDNYLINVLKKFNPDIVGINSYIGRTLIDLMKIAKIAKENSDAIVVVGGIQATVAPKPFLDYEYIDYVVRGEGELALLDMCSLIDKGKKDFSKVLNVNQNKMRLFINLNEFPLPDYSLINIKRYPLPTFITSRGCYGKCTFCYNNYYWGKLGKACIRFYDTKHTIDMITSVIDKHNIKEFYVVDDNFANKSKRTMDICNELSRHNALFTCELRADNSQDEVMKALRKAGCLSIQFGIESGSQRILDFIRKGTSVRQNAEAIRQCKKFGVFSDASIMIGMPTETIEDMNKTVNFINKNKPDNVSAKKFTPFPGTEIWGYCIKKGLFKEPKELMDFSKFEFLNNAGPNVSEIPTELLEKTVNSLDKTNNFSDFKKAVKMIGRGHYKYMLYKITQRIKDIIKSEK